MSDSEPNALHPNPTIGDGWLAMPHYRASKEVWALRIGDIQLDHQGATITPQDPAYPSFRVDSAFVAEHQPRVGGYYVVGSDSGASFVGEYRFVSEYSADPQP